RRGMTSAMEQRLRDLGVMSADGEPSGPVAVARLYGVYEKAGGDRRNTTALEEEGNRRLSALRDRGFDLGTTNTTDANRRIEAIYPHARPALYSLIQDAVVRDATMQSVRVRPAARDRDDYLARPPAGERLMNDDAQVIARLPGGRPAHVQVVVSDGLN